MIFGKTTDPVIDERLERMNNFSSFKNQMSIGLNMIVSVFVCFGLGYYIAKHMKIEEKNCLVIGLICSVLIMFIEMTLFILRAVRVESKSSEDEIMRGAARSPGSSTSSIGADSRGISKLPPKEFDIVQKKNQ